MSADPARAEKKKRVHPDRKTAFFLSKRCFSAAWRGEGGGGSVRGEEKRHRTGQGGASFFFVTQFEFLLTSTLMASAQDRATSVLLTSMLIEGRGLPYVVNQESS